VEAFFTWLLQNLAWDALKKLLPTVGERELAIFKQALEDAQGRLKELESDRKLLAKIVQQRNRALAELTVANRRIKELEGRLSQIEDNNE
jgi:DNA-binding transcriptional regulator GbsR (MarR family)